jgi:hypothetical protein
MTEYIQVSSEQKTYTEKSLLESQLGLISIIKHLDAYKSLRSDEITLKIALKAKIDELKEKIRLFEKLLPKTKYKDKFAEEKRIVHEAKILKLPEIHETIAKKKKEEFDIEKELDEIQKKLQRLER